jgi:AraC-like DNA-binding protein
VEYREHKIADPTSPFSCVWELRSTEKDIQRIVPDGRAEIVIHLGDPFEEHRDGSWHAQSSAALCGQITGPLMLRGTGVTHTCGVRLRSWATGSVAGESAARLTDVAVDTSVLARPLRELIVEAVRTDDVDRLRTFHVERSATNVQSLVHVAVRSHGQCSVDDMARTAGLSARHIDRLMLEHVGVTPKVFLRLLRFRRAMSLASAHHTSWADLAARCGYHDQSHMIRDFKQFAGSAPAAVCADESDLARCFVDESGQERG